MTPEQPRNVIPGESSATSTGFKAGFGAVFGIIAAIVVIIIIIAVATYKSPYQRWSDCVDKAYSNGQYDATSICGPEPGP